MRSSNPHAVFDSYCETILAFLITKDEWVTAGQIAFQFVGFKTSRLETPRGVAAFLKRLKVNQCVIYKSARDGKYWRVAPTL